MRTKWMYAFFLEDTVFRACLSSGGYTEMVIKGGTLCKIEDVSKVDGAGIREGGLMPRRKIVKVEIDMVVTVDGEPQGLNTIRFKTNKDSLDNLRKRCAASMKDVLHGFAL